MKKFLKSLPAIITFCVVTALFLGLTIGFAVRPVSRGLAYSGTQVIGSKTEKFTLKFKNDREVVFDNGKETHEHWYIRNGNKIFVFPKSDAVASVGYDEYVKLFKANKEQWNAVWESDTLYTINAFKVTNSVYKVSATSGGAIALTVVFGVLTLAGVAGTTLSTLLYVKNKKAKKTA